MNTDTGEIRRLLTQEDLAGLESPWVPVSEKVADAVEIGMHALNHAERRALKYPKNNRRDQTGWRGRTRD